MLDLLRCQFHRAINVTSPAFNAQQSADNDQPVAARAVRIDAEIIRQSSRFSVRIATTVSAGMTKLFTMISSQTAVSLSSFDTILSLWMKSDRLSAALASP